MDDILSANDVALICNVDRHTVRRWCTTGLLKGKRLNAWTWAITREAVDAALESGTIRKSPSRGRRPVAAMLGQRPLK